MTRTYVFLHGSPGNAAGWAPLIEQAPAGTSCQAWDLLDHGTSLAPEATLDDTVDDVVRRVTALSRPVTLVGHSFGTWVAGHALAQLGAQVERFVAIAGLAVAPAEVAERGAGFASALESGQVPLAAAAQGACDVWLPGGGNADPVDVARVMDLVTSDTIPRLARVLRRQPGLADPARRVPRYTTPSTSIHCAEDRAVPIALGRELSALGAASDFVELPGDSHFPQWTHTERVAEIVFGR